MSCIRCIQCCRDLCWASELQMGVEFQRFRKQLDKEAEDVPSWFHDKLIRWIKLLPTPLYMPQFRGSISQIGRNSILQLSSTSLQTSSFTPSSSSSSSSLSLSLLNNVSMPLRKPPRVTNNLGQQNIKIKFSLKNLSQTLCLMVTKKHTPEFMLYQTPFLEWNNRVLLLNTLWRGFFCMTEDWVTPFTLNNANNQKSKSTQSIMPSASPVYHTDIHALSILCKLLMETNNKESNTSLKRIINNISLCFENVLNTLQPYSLNNFSLPKNLAKNSSILFRKIKELENVINPTLEDIKLKSHLDNIVSCYEFSKKCINVLQSVGNVIERFYISTIKYRTIFKTTSQNTTSYYSLNASLLSESTVQYTIHDPVTDWNIKISGSINIMKSICCNWSDTIKNGLFELITAFNQSINSSSKFIHRVHNISKNESNIYCLHIHVIKERTIMTIFDPFQNESFYIETSTEFHYILRSNTRVIKMICCGADILQQFWNENFDPELVSLIKEILGPNNTGNANSDLSTVLKSARENIKDSVRMLEQKCSLLLLTQIGFCLTNYSPWDLNWIDIVSIEDCEKVNNNNYNFIYYIINFIYLIELYSIFFQPHKLLVVKIFMKLNYLKL